VGPASLSLREVLRGSQATGRRGKLEIVFERSRSACSRAPAGLQTLLPTGVETHMKRDLDLIRQLLIFFEEKESPQHIEVPPIEGYDELAIKYHLVLLYDAGLLRCEPVRSSTSDRVIYVLPFALTWEGHEFLDKVKNESVWKKIRTVVASKGGSLAFSVVNQLATRYALEMVKDV